MTNDEALKELYLLVAAAPTVQQTQQEMVAVATSSVAADGGGAVAASNTQVASTTSRVGDQLALITQQLDLLRAVQQAQADAVAENTKTLAQSTASKVGSAVSSVAGGGGGLLGSFLMSPIVSGLMKLFGGGGGSEATPAPLVQYSAPSSLRVQAGLSNGNLTEADYGAGDKVRAVPAATQVTVQVQAMDSRSFLDRSDDIAKAVRQAMLESHAINDVVAEL